MAKKELKSEPIGSQLWEKYKGAFGNMSAEMETLLSDPDNEENTEDVYQGINHQMSFYPAAYIVLPHLAELLEQRIGESKIEWVEYCLFNVAMTIASDNKRGRVIGKGEEATADVLKNYKLSVRRIKKTAKVFYRKNRKQLTHKSESSAAKLVFGGFGAIVYMIAS